MHACYSLIFIDIVFTVSVVAVVTVHAIIYLIYFNFSFTALLIHLIAYRHGFNFVLLYYYVHYFGFRWWRNRSKAQCKLSIKPIKINWARCRWLWKMLTSSTRTSISISSRNCETNNNYKKTVNQIRHQLECWIALAVNHKSVLSCILMQCH